MHVRFVLADLLKSVPSISPRTTMDPDHENWHVRQGAILTGGGKLLRQSAVHVDYLPSDLPHFHLSRGTSKQVFEAWITANRRSMSIIGCWSRPLFSGGWLESTSADTEAFNLQTPSLFIDMRFPLARSIPSSRGSFSDCTVAELRMLARQHCFGGYSLPEPTSDTKSTSAAQPLVFTRHHIVDWNYHPSYARPRPNRWWVEISDETPHGPLSFKEHSTVRDEHGVPVYMERWQRREPLLTQKYLACRKGNDMFVCVGQHFAIALDRPPTGLLVNKSDCSGGGAFFVDYLLSIGKRAEAEAYLSLEGSCGLIPDVPGPWTIRRSTLPWREGTDLLHQASFTLLFDKRKLKQLAWMGEDGRAGVWDVLECNWTEEELRAFFPQVRSKL